MPRKSHKPRRPPRKDEYRKFAAEWERRKNDPDRGAANWIVEPAGLAVDATALMATLRVLASITQDPAFDAARSAVVAHALVDADGKWKRPAILASQVALEVCEVIEETIASGVPQRQALAGAAAELNIAAQSFGAAVARVRRLFREYRVTRNAEKMSQAGRRDL
jgi:hypothetical protein